MQALFQLDVVGHEPEHSLDLLLEGFETSPETRAFAQNW